MASFKKGDKVKIVKRNGKVNGWGKHQSSWNGLYGDVLDSDVSLFYGEGWIRVHRPEDKDWHYFPVDCLVLAEQAQPEPPQFTINEPLQAWEKF